jgi:hypothetical protein
VATPGLPASWGAEDEAAQLPPAARMSAAATARTGLTGTHPRGAWHGAASSLADPSDEPSEDSDGWVSALDQGLPSAFGLDWTVADAPGLSRGSDPRPPLPIGTTCRLRC